MLKNMRKGGFAIIFIILALVFVIGVVIIAILSIGAKPDLLNSDLTKLKDDPINKIVYPNAMVVATVYGRTEYDVINSSVSGAYIEKVFVSQDPQEAIYQFYKEAAAKSGIKPEISYEEEFTLPCFAGDTTVLEKSYGNPEGRGCSGSFINPSPSKDYFKISFPSKTYPQSITYRIEFVSQRMPYLSNIRFFDKTKIKDFDFSPYKTVLILKINVRY